MLSKVKVLFRLKDAIHEIIYRVEQYRLGRVLTIIDASISDSEQRKAVKDLVKDAFFTKEYYTNNLSNIIEQFCNILGIDAFTSSGEKKEFMGSQNDYPTPPVEEYFHESLLQEEKKGVDNK